ncbi:MAG TPA: LysR family transcriptional regulator [Desulfonatronum sp.]|nr:LysR family transcriptional regulator [Desulfonatronum sp.]
MIFGIGKAQLLAGIERHGSLNKAAQEMGMSYRAAWGKIKQAEHALGLQLVEKSGNCRDGCHLTDAGRMYKELFIRWFTAVEKAALSKAEELFPWPLRGYQEPAVPGATGNTGLEA